MTERGRDRRMRIGGMSLHVREAGDGPPVLLINGLGAHTDMWAPLERTLASRFRVISYDAPGVGRSATPPVPVAIPVAAWVARTILDRLDVDQADVLGYSLGGMVAQQLALGSPKRVRRLVLVGTTPGWGGVIAAAGPLLNISTPLRYYSPAFYRRTIGGLTGGRARRDPDWVARHGELRQRHPPTTSGYLGQVWSAGGFSAWPMLHRIHQPTLVVTGDDDPLIPHANAMLLASRLPEARVVLAEGEGHLLLMDPDSAVLEPIRDFLAADPLAEAPVWKDAIDVDDEVLQEALAAAPRQAQPWGAVSAIVRRAWPTPGGAKRA